MTHEPIQPDLAVQSAAQHDPELRAAVAHMIDMLERNGAAIGAQNIDARDQLARAISAAVNGVMERTTFEGSPADVIEALASVCGQVIVTFSKRGQTKRVAQHAVRQLHRSIDHFSRLQIPIANRGASS